MKREAQFTPRRSARCSPSSPRGRFSPARAGSGRPIPSPSISKCRTTEETVDFQLSQRADHIVNDIYQWVQFNRAIINARDEPLADYRKYRRLHLLIGDSNMSPFANALKIGTTACILTLLENGLLPNDLTLLDAVQATREISRDPTQRWIVELENGQTIGALDVQWRLHALARAISRRRGRGDRLAARKLALHARCVAVTNRRRCSAASIGSARNGCSKPSWRRRICPGTIRGCKASTSNITTSIPARGLFFGLQPAKRIGEWNNLVRQKDATRTPPADTRASGRAHAVAAFRKSKRPYVINWDSIACESHDFLVMGDPFKTYVAEVEQFVQASREAEPPP